MDYSHNWAFDPTSHRYAAAWPILVADTSRVLAAVAALGIALTGPDGTGAPVADRYTEIAFTGPGGDPLRLPAPYRNPHPSPCGTPPPVTGWCRTQRQPYDLAVTATLLRAHLLLGHDFSIRSSGTWTGEWLHGVRDAASGARGLVAELFAAQATGSPLSWAAPHRGAAGDVSQIGGTR